MAELSNRDGDNLACKAGHIYYLALYKKHLPIPERTCAFVSVAWSLRTCWINGYVHFFIALL